MAWNFFKHTFDDEICDNFYLRIIAKKAREKVMKEGDERTYEYFRKLGYDL